MAQTPSDGASATAQTAGQSAEYRSAGGRRLHSVALVSVLLKDVPLAKEFREAHAGDGEGGAELSEATEYAAPAL